MTRDDLPPDPPGGDDASDADPDRAAILARRKRFIAIALSGLASGVGCAQPCLSVARPTSDGDEQKADPGRPEACLKVAAPESQPPEATPPTEAKPEACLKVAAPSTKDPEPTPTKPEAAPCLKVAAPPPTKEPEAAPKPETKAKPVACLKVSRPRDD